MADRMSTQGDPFGQPADNTGLEGRLAARTEAELSLQQERDFTAAVLHTIGTLVLVLDREGRIIRFNRGCEETTGYSSQEVLGRYFWDLFLIPEEVEPVRGVFESLRAGQFPNQYENYWLTKGGDRRLIAWSNTALANPEGRVEYVIGTGIDVTERRRVEEELRQYRDRLEELVDERTAELRATNEELRESEERFRATFEQAAVGIAHVALDGRWLRVNRKLCEIVGYTYGELLELTFQDITHPDDLEADLEYVREMLAGKIETYSMEKRYLRKDGSLVWIHLTVALMHEPSGAPRYFISVIEDITQRKELQEALARQTHELARSNTELEQFVYATSHDLQEPLRKIQTFGDRLKAKCGEAISEEGRGYLERMMNASGRMQTLINDLLSYSRLTTRTHPFMSVDLNEVVQGVLSDMEATIELSGGRVEVGELPTLDADPVQMRQLLQNLISNALKFRRREEPPVVRVEAQLLFGADRLYASDAVAKRLCRITVQDNGIGFDEKYLNRIFGLFQRLHPRVEYAGTGVGLAICRRIVVRHGGSITARSAPEEGATFVVTLPLQQAKGER